MSEYKDIIDEMRWSFSRLNSFHHCKYEFYLNYIIDNDEVYLSESNYYAEVGSFVHEILAKIFNKELTPDEAAQYYVNNYDNNIFHDVRKTIMYKTFEACADYFSLVDFSWLDNYEILGVEMETNFEIDKYKFVGYIDLLLRDKEDNKIVVVDHKSSAYPFKQNGEIKKNAEDNFESYKKQMYLYAYAVKKLYGEFPKAISWNHFKEGGKFATINFSEDEYNKSIEWAKETIRKIEKEKEFEPNMSFFYCTNLCNFRNSCEYCENAEWK